MTKVGPLGRAVRLGWGRQPGRAAQVGRPAVASLAALLAVVLVAGCSAEKATGIGTGIASGLASAPPSTAYPDVAFLDDLDFGAADGIRLDVCLPNSRAQAPLPLPAILSVHGGGWARGDKEQQPWRETCAWLASEGFVVFQANYRLAPRHPFPAAIDDLTLAVNWIRAEAQVARFDLDPARLGAFGDSAGGNLAALLGTRGSGSTTTGSRVSAVVALSGPFDLTPAGSPPGGLDVRLEKYTLDYLGCASLGDCAAAGLASPISQIDATDPPMFIAHSVGDFVPVGQADRFVAALEEAGVDATYRRVPGSQHALGLLDDELRASVGVWLREKIGVAEKDSEK